MNREKFSEKELEEAWERNKKSTKYVNGSIWESNGFDRFEVIGKFDSRNLYIRFLNTGAIYIRRSDVLESGNVKDYYAPIIFNVGFTGEGKYSSRSYPHLYNRWRGMLERCYGDKERNPSYKDVTVDSRWHNFQNYCSDITNMMNEQGLENLDGYEIDKDIKQPSGAKVYSKDTISIVTKAENNKEMIDRIHDTVYIGINLNTREEIEFTNQAEFARKNNINKNCISGVLAGKCKRAGDWTFYKKGDKAPHMDIVIYIAENIKTGEKIEFTNNRSFEIEYDLYKNAVSRVLRGERKTAKGYRFYRKEEQPQSLALC